MSFFVLIVIVGGSFEVSESSEARVLSVRSLYFDFIVQTRCLGLIQKSQIQTPAS